MHRDLGVPLLALLAAVLIWGTTFVVTAGALDGSSPAVLTVARFAVAAVVLVRCTATPPMAATGSTS